MLLFDLCSLVVLSCLHATFILRCFSLCRIPSLDYFFAARCISREHVVITNTEKHASSSFSTMFTRICHTARRNYGAQNPNLHMRMTVHGSDHSSGCMTERDRVRGYQMVLSKNTVYLSSQNNFIVHIIF
jgi:hypothetical protein